MVPYRAPVQRYLPEFGEYTLDPVRGCLQSGTGEVELKAESLRTFGLSDREADNPQRRVLGDDQHKASHGYSPRDRGFLFP
jgi:hypothetical protein